VRVKKNGRITKSKKKVMSNNKLHWKSVLELINKGEKPENIKLEFNDEKIFWKDALLLGENGFEIPDDLIDYDDENIDFSDIPEIKQEDIESGKIKWIYKAEIPIRKEINDWAKDEKVDMNKLIKELLENFYDTVKNIHKNTAI